MTVRWHHACAGDVPVDDEWLTDAERVVVTRLTIAKRRADWRLGRLDVRQAIVVAGDHSAGWAPMAVTWRTEEIIHRGWWRHDDRLVIAVVTDPPSDAPERCAP